MHTCTRGLGEIISEMELSEFEALHRAQLQAIGFPLAQVLRLWSKLSTSEAENLKGSFELRPDKDRSLSACGTVLKCNRTLSALSDVFVLQHMWESDGGEEARKALLTDPVLLGRVESAVGIVVEGGGEGVGVSGEMVRVVCEQSGKSEAVALEALSDSGYDLIAAIALAREAERQTGKRRREHPTLSMQEFRKGLDAVGGKKATADLPEGQIQAMYEDWKCQKSREPTKDGDGWTHCGAYSWQESDEGVISVSIPLPPATNKKSIVSDITSKRWRFGVRGERLVIDGEFFGRVVPDECFWTVEGGCVSVSVQKCEGEGEWGVLLVGEVQLEEVQGDRGRGEEGGVALRVDEVMDRMWRVNQTYTAVTQEDRQCPVWYLMEPHGLALAHSPTPNFACHPFANALIGCVVSLLWPVADVMAGEACSRDYTPALYPGETLASRHARAAVITAFKSQARNCLNPSPTPQAISRPLSSSSSISPLPLSTTSLSTTSSPTMLYISTANTTNSQWAQPSSWQSSESYAVAPSPGQADLVLGYHELLSPDLPQRTSCRIARLEGDQVLVHKTEFCRLVRGREWSVQGVDLRSEVGLLTLPTSVIWSALKTGVVGSWYLLAPDGPWSAVPRRLSNHWLEMVRWSEVGPAVAMQFCQRTVLHRGQCCCLQFSVVVMASTDGGSLAAFLHPQPRVRLASRTRGEAGFQPWDIATLITSSSYHVDWSEFLSSVEAQYKTEWSQCRPQVTQAVSELFSLALPQCTGRGALYTVDVLLLHRTQLIPIIIGVDPLPSFVDSSVATDCLNLLTSRGGNDKFVSI